MNNTNTKVLLCGYVPFHTRKSEPMAYITVPKNPSYAELNRGKKSKRERRK